MFERRTQDRPDNILDSFQSSMCITQGPLGIESMTDSRGLLDPGWMEANHISDFDNKDQVEGAELGGEVRWFIGDCATKTIEGGGGMLEKVIW